MLHMWPLFWKYIKFSLLLLRDYERILWIYEYSVILWSISFWHLGFYFRKWITDIRFREMALLKIKHTRNHNGFSSTLLDTAIYVCFWKRQPPSMLASRNNYQVFVSGNDRLCFFLWNRKILQVVDLIKVCKWCSLKLSYISTFHSMLAHSKL